MREKRRKIWIDRFQTQLSLRLASYFLLYQTVVWCWVAVWQTSFATLEGSLGKGVSDRFFLLTGLGVAGVGLLFTYRAVKFGHRIVGPLYRFRKTVQAVTAGEEITVIRLREGDFLQELKDDFNAMLRELERRGAVVVRTADGKRDPAGQLTV